MSKTSKTTAKTTRKNATRKGLATRDIKDTFIYTENPAKYKKIYENIIGIVADFGRESALLGAKYTKERDGKVEKLGTKIAEELINLLWMVDDANSRAQVFSLFA